MASKKKKGGNKKPPQGPFELNLDATFHRKAKAAGKAMHSAISPVMEQVLGAWDQDDQSTVAHLLGLQQALAYALGAVHSELTDIFVTPELPMSNLQESLEAGRRISLVRSFRSGDKTPKKKKTEQYDNIIVLPVVRKGPS